MKKIISKSVKFLQDTNSSLQLIPCKKAKDVLQQCQVKLGNTIKCIANEINDEHCKVQAHLQAVLPAILTEYKLTESLESDVFEPDAAKAACADIRVQQIYLLFAQGKPGFVAAHGMLNELCVFCNMFVDVPVFREAVTWIEAVLLDIGKLIEGDLTNKSGFTYSGYVIGTLTLAQSLLRDLVTGETRQNLVYKALNGVKTRGFKCKPSLLQKCEAVVNGKSVK